MLSKKQAETLYFIFSLTRLAKKSVITDLIYRPSEEVSGDPISFRSALTPP
jgi:hypothetical protein